MSFVAIYYVCPNYRTKGVGTRLFASTVTDSLRKGNIGLHAGTVAQSFHVYGSCNPAAVTCEEKSAELNSSCVFYDAEVYSKVFLLGTIFLLPFQRIHQEIIIIYAYVSLPQFQFKIESNIK